MRLQWALCHLGVVLLLACGGCEIPPKTPAPNPVQTPEVTPQGGQQSPPTVPSGFAPAKVGILPLSEIRGAAGIGQDARLTVYVTLLDAFGCPIKAPCTLRFEVYEYVRRSAQPKGQRLEIWPDIDLMQPVANQNAWRDFLRAYEFQFSLQANREQTYVVEVTYLGPDGKRLSGQCAIRAGL